MSSFRIDLTFPSFQAEYKRAFKIHKHGIKSGLAEVLSQLENGRHGDQMPRVGPQIYKIRVAIKGQSGKSGGYRLIYHVDAERSVIYPVMFYFKSDVPNLNHTDVRSRLEALTRFLLEQTAMPFVSPEKPS